MSSVQLAAQSSTAYVQASAEWKCMPEQRTVKLFRNGRNQAVRIPVEFELPGDSALMHREGDRIVIEPSRKPSLLEILATFEPLADELPNIDENLLPLDDIEL